MRFLIVESPVARDFGAFGFGLAVAAILAVVALVSWLWRHSHLSGPAVRTVGVLAALVAGTLGLVAGAAGLGPIAWVWVAGAAACVWLLTLPRHDYGAANRPRAR